MSRRAATSIDRGDVESLRALIRERPEIVVTGYDNSDPPSDDYHLLTHLVSWPGGRPNGAAAARLLLEHGADPSSGSRVSMGIPTS